MTDALLALEISNDSLFDGRLNKIVHSVTKRKKGQQALSRSVAFVRGQNPPLSPKTLKHKEEGHPLIHAVAGSYLTSGSPPPFGISDLLSRPAATSPGGRNPLLLDAVRIVTPSPKEASVKGGAVEPLAFENYPTTSQPRTHCPPLTSLGACTDQPPRWVVAYSTARSSGGQQVQGPRYFR